MTGRLRGREHDCAADGAHRSSPRASNRRSARCRHQLRHAQRLQAAHRFVRWDYTRGAIFNVGYTLARSKDQAAAPVRALWWRRRFRRSWGRDDGGTPTFANGPPATSSASTRLSPRDVAFGQGLEVTAFGRMSSGAPFTPLVSADINGDGARNDRAFLFNPSDPNTSIDPPVAAGMQRLLASAPGAVRDCLTRQLGSVATRNSCTGVWQPSLDFQLNWRPNVWGLNRRLAISVVTVNTLGGLDELLHGSNNLRGWGQFRGQDNTLLYVRGFDAAAQTYRYEVNERFGAARNGANGIRVPFQLGINARYTLGPDRMRDMIQGMRGGGGGGGASWSGRASAAQEVRRRSRIMALRRTPSRGDAAQGFARPHRRKARKLSAFGYSRSRQCSVRAGCARSCRTPVPIDMCVVRPHPSRAREAAKAERRRERDVEKI